MLLSFYCWSFLNFDENSVNTSYIVYLGLAEHLKLFARHLIGFNYGSSLDMSGEFWKSSEFRTHWTKKNLKLTLIVSDYYLCLEICPACKFMLIMGSLRWHAMIYWFVLSFFHSFHVLFFQRGVHWFHSLSNTLKPIPS